ncbi:unnamed protein product [Adineta ricciae]|uniref:Tyrosine-protein phosphatase non-receptor type 23 n=1 Tax=Adineta ricciae TaxID=249248 RepID=A0A814E7G6_ADIRI|nr:unnamed protein product [Adineta ricciae]
MILIIVRLSRLFSSYLIILFEFIFLSRCPRLPTIGFDPKVSIESVNLCEKIPNYITSTYQESGDKYASECEQMNRLRQNTINSTADQSGIQLLKQYYCQLLLLRNRFPMLPETECAVRFTWEDAYQKEENSYNDIRFEEACILYNLGAMYSRLGANEPRRTHDSIKNACTYFRCAASCYEKVRDQYTTYTSDLTPDLLTCQVHVLLAQAHEAVLEKSLLDQRAASVNAHIAMQISEYYQMALLNLTKPGINSIVSKRFREWRVALTYKLSYYLALAYYFSGLVAEESKKYGQSVCYYEAAVERLKEAWKNAEKISSDKTNVFKDAHTFTYDVVMGKFKVAKRDNDSVYFEKVPALSSLQAVQGAIVAKPQPFDCHDAEVCGPDIFQKLVPLDAHLAASEYSEEKAKLLREIVELTENKNRELDTFMLCLQLDRIPLNNEYLRLPRELLECCAAVAARPNMSKDLVSAMQQVNSQHHDVTGQLDEFEQALTNLAEKNDSVKSDKEFKDFQTNLKTIRDMMIQANESNIGLHRHMTTIIDHLKILQLPMEQLEKTLPIITEFDDEANKAKLARLVFLNEKVETMKKQRETLLADFRKKIHGDDITKLVLMQRQENHKGLFANEMKKHEEITNYIKQNCSAQDNILQSLTEANAEIADVRTKMGTTYETRNRLIQDYINSFKAFEDILSKAHEGIEFYKKQSAKLVKLNERLTSLQPKYQSPTIPAIPSRSSLHRQIPSTRPSRQSPLPTWYAQDVPEPQFPTPSLPPTISDRPRLKDYLAAMKPDTWGSTTTRSSKRSSATSRDDNLYIPPPTSHIGDGNDLSNASMPSPTSLPTFNRHSYQIESATHFERPSMPYAPLPAQPLAYEQPKYNQSYPVNSHPTLPAQNFGNQPQVSYQQQFYPSQPASHQPNIAPQPTFHQPAPPPPQQTIQQPLPPNQPMFHQSVPTQPMFQHSVPQPPPAQQIYHQPPPTQPIYHQSQLPQQQPIPQQLPPQQQFYPSHSTLQQPMYQPPPVQQQQQFHQPSSFQQPTQPPFPHQLNHYQIPQPQPQPPTTTLPTQQPTMYQNQSLTDPNRSAQQVLPPTKFDPYRPQPVGAYDIPKSQNTPFVPPIVPPSQHQQQQNMMPPTARLQPQDVYRPGGLLSTSSPQIPPGANINNNSSSNNYNTNQFVQYVPTPTPPLPPPVTPLIPSPPAPVPPPPPPLVPSPSSVKAQVDPVSTQSSIPKIDDDLLSIALEQQLETTLSMSNPEPITRTPEPECLSPIDDELQVKSNGKPIACIQPLSISTEEKQPVQSPVTPMPTLTSQQSQDSHDEKDKLDQLIADVQRFEKHVSTMTKKTLNGTVPLEVEWKELSDLQEKDVHTQTCAIGKCNPKLNRFQDLIPYDNSRVRLVQSNHNSQKHFNDYINATLIGKIRDASFITAQYPLQSTIGQFWSMIYDQHVAIVAVLLRPDEMQSIDVYPQKVGEELQISSFTITLLSTKSPNQLTNHRIIRVHHSQTNQSRTVVWLEHFGWPPKEMPDNPAELLKFTQEVQHFLTQTRNPRSTILVTCMSGVSRTGPFLTLFTSIQDIDEGRSFPDLNKIIRLLRTKRRNMIQDMNQLKFVYEALLRYAQERLVKAGLLNVGSIIHDQSTSSNMKSISPNTKTVLLAEEMQTIMDKAKPLVQSTPNYDVGPILSSTPTSTILEEKPPVKQLTPIEANFNLRPEESHIKPKTTREDFFRTKPSTMKDLSDPFNQLDPLWTFR